MKCYHLKSGAGVDDSTILMNQVQIKRRDIRSKRSEEIKKIVPVKVKEVKPLPTVVGQHLIYGSTTLLVVEVQHYR